VDVSPKSIVGSTFAGRYEVERELGHGGTAIVYLARDLSQGRMVAVKTLRPELVETLVAPRFLREIRLTAGLHHPHIVPLLDSGEAEGVLYCVLPYMDGGTLRERLAHDRQLPLDEAVLIARTIAGALEAAHTRGLVHRDVKPANILFTAGQACLSDFGIARALARGSGDDSTTTAGIVRGTPAYMSPEQAAGNQHYDGRSDIYSLGCVLYEMIAGVQPYVGPTSESVLAQRMVNPPQRLKVYRPSVPDELVHVVERTLMIGVADRYQTAGELDAALASVEPMLPRAGTTSHRIRAAGYAARAKRRRWFIGAALAALAATGGEIGRRIVAGNEARRVPTSDVPEGDARRIAVMYLDDLTPAVVPTYVADGITEDLIDQLGAVRGLHVISPDGVRPFRRNAVPLDSIARSLRVGTIISGSIARYGMTLRVIVRLVDAATGQQLDNRSLEEKWTEVLSLQDSLAENVAFALRRRLGEEIDVRRDRAATRSYDAWETVQLGNDAARRAAVAAIVSSDARVPGLFLLADSLYARAEALDPNWVRPTIKRGAMALMLAFKSPVPPKRADSVAYRRLSPAEQHIVWIRRASQLADVALGRDRSSPDALVLRGDARFALIGAGAPASDSLAVLIERDLRAALEIRPNMARAWSTLAQVARLRGQFAEAADAAEHGFEADAFFQVSTIVATGFVAALHAGQFSDAQRWCRTGLAHYPGDPRFAECQLTMLGWTGGSSEDVVKAWRLIDDIERRDTLQLLASSWGYRRLMVGAILARNGVGDSARHLLAIVRADSAKRSSPAEANVQLLLGDRDGALATLSAYLRATPSAHAQVANHPWFQALHGDPRFTALAQGTP
jgi:serine/threonine-protein kinase